LTRLPAGETKKRTPPTLLVGVTGSFDGAMFRASLSTMISAFAFVILLSSVAGQNLVRCRPWRLWNSHAYHIPHRYNCRLTHSESHYQARHTSVRLVDWFWEFSRHASSDPDNVYVRLLSLNSSCHAWPGTPGQSPPTTFSTCTKPPAPLVSVVTVYYYKDAQGDWSQKIWMHLHVYRAYCHPFDDCFGHCY